MLLPRRRAEEALRREARRLEDRVAASDRLGASSILGDVLQHAVPARLTVGLVYLHRMIVHPHDVAVGGHDPVLDVEGLAGLVGLDRAGEHAVSVLGVQHLHPQIRIEKALLGGVPGELLVLRADVERGAEIVHGVGVDRDRELLDEGAVALLRRPEPLLGLHALGDVVGHALPIQRGSFVVADQPRVVVDPHDAAVLAQRAVVDAPFVAGLRVIGGDHPIAILGVQALLPQRRVRHPFLGGVAVDGLDLWADVEVGARFDLLDEGDRRELLDQGAEPILGDPERRLGVVSRRDVGQGALDDARTVALGDHRAVVHPDDGAVVTAQAVLAVERRPVPLQGLPAVEHRGTVVFVDEVVPDVGVGQPLERGHPREPVDPAGNPTIERCPLRVEGHLVGHDRQVFEQQTPTLLRGTDLLLGGVLLGDVDDDALIDRRLADARPDGVRVVTNPEPRPVGCAQPVLLHERRADARSPRPRRR